jgi:hypothetical protein
MKNSIEVITAIITAALLGLLVKPMLGRAARKPLPPNQISEKIWDQMILGSMGGGQYVGLTERYLFLGALWMGNEALIAGWFAFKLASKWEVWKNVVQVPKELPSIPSLEWYGARSVLGSFILTRFWVGTLVNLLVAFVAAQVGRNIFETVRFVAGASPQPTLPFPAASTWTTVVGFAIAIVGTAILFFAAPREFPQSVTHVGSGERVQARIESDVAAIARRQTRTRWGFGLLLLGTVLQLVGVITTIGAS